MMKIIRPLLCLVLFFAVLQRSAAQVTDNPTTDDKIRIIGAGIGVVSKAIENERNERKERERREEEARRNYEREQKQAIEASKRASEAAERKRRERAQKEAAERLAAEKTRREIEERERAEYMEARRSDANRILSREVGYSDAVLRGENDYKEYNHHGHTLTESSGFVIFVTDRREKIVVSLDGVDSENDQLLRIKYYNNSNYGSVRGQYMSFQNVNVSIKYKNNKNSELVYSGPQTFYVSPGVDYLKKLSVAFPINKSVNMDNIDSITINFEGGQITTYY